MWYPSNAVVDGYIDNRPQLTIRLDRLDTILDAKKCTVHMDALMDSILIPGDLLDRTRYEHTGIVNHNI